ncbi:hypothetical protein AAMO2058_000762300 [Amorphochlora amoebiformis]
MGHLTLLFICVFALVVLSVFSSQCFGPTVLLSLCSSLSSSPCPPLAVHLSLPSSHFPPLAVLLSPSSSSRCLLSQIFLWFPPLRSLPLSPSLSLVLVRCLS